jgi:hypothetical protein
MKRRTILLLGLIAPSIARAQSLDMLKSMGDPLTAYLGSHLGVTENQATGGVGAILTLAQERLVKGDFDKIAQVVPGASKYIAEAKSLGAVTGPIKDMNGLQAALGRLAMSPEVRAKFVPAVRDYIGRAGGDSVKKLLARALA